ncbi:single-stranded DNA-binding protein [Peptoniphilus equinus]|uniref:Single-stranded DNA-binding protein n=1 Tax=Peptoniphilus equinus TaxID=3016343 RepID=A0ABY7QRB6_9FIRM|nr:single-stranded DNA-binding protein [Peptoniphilus equinus]WBW49314.1 single-stranded DNA-binding protein [Peptoniphilus equinus]
MNKCIFYGIMATDVTIRTKRSYDGRAFKTLYFVLAVKDNKNYSYIPCVAYNKTAELIAQYVKKDDKLIVIGALELYDKNQGAEIVQDFTIRVKEVHFVDNRIKGANIIEEDSEFIILQKHNDHNDKSQDDMDSTKSTTTSSEPNAETTNSAYDDEWVDPLVRDGVLSEDGVMLLDEEEQLAYNERRQREGTWEVVKLHETDDEIPF